MIEVATTGPCHSRIAGIAKPVVLPVCVGPTTIADWRGSAASKPSSRAAEDQPARLSRTNAERPKIACTGPARRPGCSPAVAEPNRDDCHDGGKRHENGCERAVEGDRAGDERTGGGGPRRGGVARMSREREEYGAHLREGRVRPRSAEDPGRELPGRPEEPGENDQPAEYPERHGLERMRLARILARKPRPIGAASHAAALTTMRASVSTISCSSEERRCWTRKERCPTFQSAQPRRRWGRSSASVSESPSSSRACGS